MALAVVGTSLLGSACVGSIGDGADETPPETEVASAPAQILHRLNRLEYDNTVRDLLGTRLRPAQSFPPDGEAEGFDNIAAALKLSPTLLDRYFAAARAVVDEALDERPAYAFRYAGADMVTAGGYPVGDLWALQGNAAQVTVEVVAGCFLRTANSLVCVKRLIPNIKRESMATFLQSTDT